MPAARVIVLAGPSGSGKSYLARRLALPVFRLDDFYRDGDDPALPRIGEGANAGLPDWDDQASWSLDDAVGALAELCRTGRVETPVYDIATSSRTGRQSVALDGAGLVIAEGIFAPAVVGPLRDAGLLAAAYVIRRHPVVTFWRRLTRDLREHRKPPLVLVRRGLALMRGQRRIVAEAVAAGCAPVCADEAYAAVHRSRSRERPVNADLLRGLVQPDQRSCGPSSLVAARMLLEETYRPVDFAAEVLALHRGVTSVASAGLPWPRALGTPPWAVARQLERWTGRRWRVHVVRLFVEPAIEGPTPLFVGNRWLPRHVVLALGDGHYYDPARGTVGPRRSRWPTLWFAVLPTA